MRLRVGQCFLQLGELEDIQEPEIAGNKFLVRFRSPQGGGVILKLDHLEGLGSDMPEETFLMYSGPKTDFEELDFIEQKVTRLEANAGRVRDHALRGQKESK